MSSNVISSLANVVKTWAVKRFRPLPLLCAVGLWAGLLAGGATGSPANRSATELNRVWLAVDGRDQTCRRNDRSRPCATFDRAYHVARGGDTVVVARGRYPVTAPREGATYIDPDTSKRSAVTFACAGGAVTFAAQVFAFHPGLNGVTFRGGCFHFHVPYFGYGGYSGLTQNITLDGVHMEGLNCAGCKNVTIRNSTIGPFVACYMPSDGNGAPSYADCDKSNPAQAYWASVGGTSVVQQEPFVHSGASAGAAVNFRLDHDVIHGITSKWSGTHTGCLQTWDTEGLVITNSTFDHCAIYDINLSAPSIDNDVTLTNNTFGPPVYSLDPTEPKPNRELPVAFSEGEFGATSYGVDHNWLIQGNSFTHGIRMGTPESTYSNAQVLNNNLGRQSDCAGRGVVYKGNTGSCTGR